MSYTESSLKALTVVKLKEILSNHSLAVTGKKDDLISRILESNLGEHTSEEPSLDPTGQSTDEPDGSSVGTTQELAPAAQQTTKDGEEQSVTTAQQDQDQVDEEKGDEVSEEDKLREREEAKKMEEEKRKQRLARFGGGEAANGGVDEKEEEKKKRAERFGLNVNQDENDSSKLNKSLDALDKPLGSNRRERKPKSDKPSASSKSQPNGERTAAEKTGNVQAAAEPAAAAAATAQKKELDPEQQKRLQEDEEKKKKRAARFGAPTDSEPQEKKAKTD